MLKGITDSQWARIRPHLPRRAAVVGRPKSDDHTTVNATVFVLVTGCRWADLPPRYGSKSTAHRRF